MFHRLFFSILICLFSSIIQAQTVTIIDKETKEPIPFATFNSLKKNNAEVSNEIGEIELSSFGNQDSVSVRALGYQAYTLCVCDIKKMNWQIALQRKSQIIETVVISGSRWAQPSASSAKKISIIKAKDGQLTQAQTSADVLSASGQVYIQKSEQGGGSPMIRGFSANRLLYAIDGVRINNAIYRSGNLHNVIAIDPFAISSTEVLFGPGSVMYGSDAIGGVMHFNTIKAPYSKDSTVLFSGQVFTRYASANNENTGHLDFSLANQKLSYTTSITFSKFGDLKMGTNGPNDYLYDTIATRLNDEDAYAILKDKRIQNQSGYKQYSVFQKLNWSVEKNKELSLTFNHSASSNIPRTDRLIQKQNGKPRNAEWYYGPQIWSLISLQYLDKTSRYLSDQFKVTTAFQNFSESRHNRRYNRNTLNHNYEKVEAYSLNLDLKKRLGSKVHFFYGTEIISNNINSKGEAENILSKEKETILSRYPNSNWNSAAAYIESQFQLAKKSSISAGLRYNYFALESKFNKDLFPYPVNNIELTFSSPSYSLAYLFKLNQSFSFRASYAGGFRAPNIDDIAKVFDSEPGSVTVPNPELKAETADNYELGFELQLNQKFAFDFATYYTRLNSAMVRRNDKYFGQDSITYQNVLSQVQSIQNAAEAYVYGLELSLNYSFLKSLNLSANYNYQQGEEELEDGSKSYSRHVAPNFAQITLTYQKEKYKFILMLEHNSEISFEKLNVGERNKDYLYAKDKQGRPYSPEWTVLHFLGELNLSKDFVLSGGIKNIGDIRYRPYSSGISAPGRNYILALKYQW